MKKKSESEKNNNKNDDGASLYQHKEDNCTT